MKQRLYTATLTGLVMVAAALALWFVAQGGASAQEITEADAQEFRDYVCEHLEPRFVEATSSDGHVTLLWEVIPAEILDEEPKYEESEYTLTFRLERSDLYGGTTLYIHILDTQDFSFEETHTTWGAWDYRIYIFSVTIGPHTLECEAPLFFGFMGVDVRPHPTPQQLTALARHVCENTRIVDLDGEGDWSDTWLGWGVQLEENPDMPWLEPAIREAPFWGRAWDSYEMSANVTFRVDRQSGETTGPVWRSQEDVVNDFHWYGESAPGLATYRVALESIELYHQLYRCATPLNFAYLEITTPTTEARSQVEMDWEVLTAETTRCARTAFLRHISEEAAPIVSRHVDSLVKDMMPQYGESYEIRDAIRITLLTCATASDDSSDGLNAWQFWTMVGGLWW